VQKTPRGPYYTQDPEWYDSRRERIVQARREGQTLTAIGETWGITGQRVRQIIVQGLRGKKTKAFKCVRCGIEEQALPTGTTDLMGGTHFTYHTPKGWWSITTREGMLLFCADEAITIKGGEVLERGRGG
jgi:hypothetical protein